MKVSMRLQRSILRGIFAALATLACAPLAQAAGILPAGYVEVEYIQGNGSNTRIITNYTPQPNIDKIEAVVEFPTLDTTQRAIWCARGAWNASTWTLFIINGNRFRFDYASNTGSSANIAVAASTKYTVTAASNQVVCASETQSGTHTYAKVDDFTCGGPLTLFYAYVDEPENNKGNWANHRLYSFKVWRSDELIHYFIPCKDADGKATMVDICHNPATLTTEGTFAAGDEGHFFDDSSYTDSLYISSMPEHIGTPSPSGNVTDLAVGATVEVSCGATPWTNATETAVYVYTGWKLYDKDGNLDSSGAETSFTYTHPDPASYRCLEWQWALSEVQGTVTAAAGGTVSPSGTAWYSGSAPVTVTATPDAGKSFVCWTGTLPDGIDETAASVTFTPTAPFDMMATFCPSFTVATNGNDTAAGTAEAPLLTISNALEKADAAIAGGAETVTILLADGTYSEHLLYVTNAITITSVSGDRDAVVVDATGLTGKRGSVFRLNHADATLSGITVINGRYAWKGGNVYIDTNGGTVRNCVVANGKVDRDWSAGYHGGNIYMDSSKALVVDCVVTNGDAATASGDYGYGGNICAMSGRISRCVIADGKAMIGTGGGNVYLNTATIENCLVTGGTLKRAGGQGTAIYVNNAGARVVNCTIAGNYPMTGDTAAAVWLQQAGRVVNCVIYDNGGTMTKEWGNRNASCFYNCAFAADAEFTGANSTVLDLIDTSFKNYAGGDYAPAAGSSLIDAGLSNVSAHTALDCSVDLNQYGRPFGETWDIGCYEYTLAPGEVDIAVSVSAVAALNGEPVTFTPTILGITGEILCKWDFEDGGSPLIAAYEPITHAFATTGAHHPTLSVSTDGGYAWVPYALPVTIQTAPPVMWLDASCTTPAFPYATEATAATNLTDVLNVLTNALSEGATAIDGVTVKVKPNTYVGTGYPTIASAVTVLGMGGNRDAVVFDANKSGKAFTLNHAGAVLSGLTVVNGSRNILISYDGGIVTNCVVASGRLGGNGQGANINMDSSSALVVDCVVTNGALYNGASYATYGWGGNIYAKSGRISRCLLADGYAGTGGGNDTYGGGNAYLNGAVKMENCLLTGGKACNHGSAVNIQNASVRVVNCTIVGNGDGNDRAAVYAGNSSARVVNCVIYGNGGTKAKEWGNKNAACFYNCAFSADAEFSGGTSCVTDLTDAAFKKYATGNYHPVANGVLFNAGNTEAYTTYGAISTTDLDGAARIVKKVIDIGCYEAASSIGLQILVR